MRTWIMWHGGSSYSAPEVDDAEEFPTLADARAEFQRRECGFDPYYPCVSGSSAWVFFTDPRKIEGGDVYPDRVFEIGPRGGLVECPA